jgi:hypothetical protein
MYYWSRWANITTENENGTDGEKDVRQSWQETGHRQAIRRDTRPVVVVMRRDTQALPKVTTQQRDRARVRNTGTRISLDVRRQTYTGAPSTGPLRPASHISDATTEDL